MKILLIDGYVDEPAHFGVPPYISAYSRYIAGIVKIAGFDLLYDTIDGVRNHGIKAANMLIVIGGVTVPGNYIGGTPMTVEEAKEISSKFAGTKIIVGSMAKYDVDRSGGVKANLKKIEGYDFSLWFDYERKLYELLKGKAWNSSRYSLVKSASIEGASVIKAHPNFPDVMCEIELGLGCEKSVKCSFCTEPLWGQFESRPIDDVIEEVSALYKAGGRYYRLGRISNIFAYKADKVPNVSAIEMLYSGIRSVAPDIKVLHTDNANPEYIYDHMKESEKITEIISSYNSSGDVLSMGVESFDPKVIFMNNLKIDGDKVIEVIKMINDVGGKREEGIPKLLPGINLLYALLGETKDTYKINFEMLMKILDDGLMVRRVNIRKAMAFPQTLLFESLGGKAPKTDERLYQHNKFMVRKSFDHEMLKRVFPSGTIFKDVIIEYHDGKISYGRQIGTYAMLIGIPKILPLRSHIDCVVVDHGQRSLTALPVPFMINTEDYDTLRWIPGISRGSSSVILKRPFGSIKELYKKTNLNFPEWMNGMISFEK